MKFRIFSSSALLKSPLFFFVTHSGCAHYALAKQYSSLPLELQLFFWGWRGLLWLSICFRKGYRRGIFQEIAYFYELPIGVSSYKAVYYRPIQLDVQASAGGFCDGNGQPVEVLVIFFNSYSGKAACIFEQVADSGSLLVANLQHQCRSWFQELRGVRNDSFNDIKTICSGGKGDSWLEIFDVSG